MSAAADVERASNWLRRIEHVEADRLELSIPMARFSVARRISATPSTLKHIREKRRKSVPAWLLAAIGRLLITVLHSEIRALEHEIALAKQAGVDDREDAVLEATATLAQARALLEEAAGG